MRNIWITVSYDGTEYAGFQRQENGFTVQEALEKVLKKLTGVHTTITDRNVLFIPNLQYLRNVLKML